MVKLQIIGHLGRDCTVKQINGKNVINFTVAHTDKFKDAQGNPKEKTIWVDCDYWTDRTAIAQYLTKGKLVFVEGQPDVRSFQRNDGTPGAALSLRVRDIQLLGGRAEGAASTGGFEGSASSQSNVTAASEVNEPIDDLPF